MNLSSPKSLIEQLRTSEQGVSAIFIAFAMILMMGFVALGIDISLNTHERQELWDTLDASSLAGASLLPDADAAYQAALDYAEANWPGVNPNIDFYCVVGFNAASNGPETTHIPAMCDPGSGPYNTTTYPGMQCNDKTCFIPCFPAQGDTCNTIRVRAESPVDYTFARIIGFNQGSTGLLNSASCKGPCGATIDVPGDIALVLDRTGSMRPEDVNALKGASRAFLLGLSSSQHQVALGTLGRSRTGASCITAPSDSGSTGPWIPVSLRDDFQVADSDPPVLNTSSQIVRGIDCLATSSTGTNLGDPLRAAGDHLLANGREGVPAGVVFMTDGEANEPFGAGNCNHAVNQAASVKSNGIVVVTIAYRLQGVSCEGTPATTVLANMASDPESGVATADDGGDGPGGHPGGCNTTAASNSENADGDLFFCAPEPGVLSQVFRRASGAILAQFAERTTLVKPPA